MKLQDTFSVLAPGAVNLQGLLGKALDGSIANRLKKVDYEHLVQPFADRNERDGLWRDEFWGKIVRSAIRSWRARPDADLLALIRKTVADIIATQTDDGCISSYPAELQTTNWDIWGRKYVLLGLCRYCTTIENDPKVREAIAKCIDHLMTQVGPGKKSMLESGHHQGMAPTSILGAIVQAYWLTGEQRFLDYAEWIFKEGGSPVFQQALSGEHPYKIGNGKAYEMTSCIEGMLELYRATGRRELKDAVCEYYRKVRDEEIFVTGVGGLKDVWGEYWFEGARNQVQDNCGNLGETCVTTTYIRFCLSMLRLTGDATIGDELERSLYNGVLGEMVPDGSWWMHVNPTPLKMIASKVRADDQLLRGSGGKCAYHEDCCLAQGPEALATAALCAVMKTPDGVAVNLFEPASVKVDEGLSLEITGHYPDEGDAAITIHTPEARQFALKIRVPAWSKNTRICFGDKVYDAVPGTYCTLERNWKEGDKVEILFQVELEVLRIPGCDFCALRRGPILLARDSRLPKSIDRPYSNPKSATLAAAVPGIRRTYQLDDGTYVCDYTSAGNTFTPDNTLRVFA